MAIHEVPDEQGIDTALNDFLRSLNPGEAASIAARPPEGQLDAALKLAEGINAQPWPTHMELTGRKNPLDVIDWVST